MSEFKEYVLQDDGTYLVQAPTYESEETKQQIAELAVQRKKELESNPNWMPQQILDQAQVNQLYQMALDIRDAFHLANVDLWIDGGTLLGSLRQGGLIPWDDDMDFAMFESDQEAFEKKVVPLLKAADYGVEPWWFAGYRIFPEQAPPIKKKFCAQRCNFPFVDLFLVKRGNGKRLLTYSEESEVYWPSGLSEEDLFPLRQYKFGPIQLPGPAYPEKHLVKLYGPDYMCVAYEEYDHKSATYKPKIPFNPKQFPVALPDCQLSSKITSRIIKRR